MKRVILVGAGGFLGAHVLRHLLNHTDWHITAVDDFGHPRGASIIRLTGLPDRGTPGRGRWDLMDRDMTLPLYRPVPVDFVINVASLSHVPDSISDPRPFVENNVSLMLTVLEWAREQDPQPKVLHISTSEVYGPAPEFYDFTPQDPHRASNPYAASKAAQEDLCRAWWRTYDIPIGIVATMNLFGEMQVKKFIPMVIGRVLRGETIQVHAPGGIPGSRYYIHGQALANALLFLLAGTELDLVPRFSSGGDFGQYHVVGEREVDNLELAQLIAKFADKNLQYELVEPDRPGHDARYGLDDSSMRELGWTPPHAFEDGLQRTVEWYLANPEWLEALPNRA